MVLHPHHLVLHSELKQRVLGHFQAKLEVACILYNSIIPCGYHWGDALVTEVQSDELSTLTGLFSMIANELARKQTLLNLQQFILNLCIAMISKYIQTLVTSDSEGYQTKQVMGSTNHKRKHYHILK